MEEQPAKSSEGRRRVVFVSVGQSPRSDVLPEIIEPLGFEIDAIEIGVLDNSSAEEICDLAPRPGEMGIISKLRSGAPVVLSKPRISEMTARLLANLPPDSFDLLVILTTGLFREFESNGPMVNAQRAMEAGLIALAADGQAIGLIQPLESQVSELSIPALQPYRVIATYAKEGDRSSIANAVMDLAESEIIVLNSIGFSEADRQIVAKSSGKPVVLARRMITSAIRLLLASPHSRFSSTATPDLTARLDRLTPREKQVLSLVAEGLSNKAIARQLGISPKTVEIHRSNMMGKMEVASTGALIRLVVSYENSAP